MIMQSNESEEAGGSCAPLGGSTSWVKGEPPLKRILLVWNSKAIFGPIAFATEAHRKQEMDRVATAPGGPVTHYLIIPKCE